MVKPVDALVGKADSIMDGTYKGLEDWRDALQMYEQAAEMGSGRAFLRIGEFYERSDKRKQNIEKSIANYKKAAYLSELHAYFNLIIVHKNTGDYQNAIKILNLFRGEVLNLVNAKKTVDLTIFLMSYLVVMRLPIVVDRDTILNGLPYSMRAGKDLIDAYKVMQMPMNSNLIDDLKLIYSISQQNMGVNEQFDQFIREFQSDLVAYLSSK